MTKIILLILFLSASAFAAQERGNGTDDYRQQGHAWFNSRTAGSYCFNQDPSFGLTRAEIQPTLQLALDTWATYIARHTELANDPSVSHLRFSFHERCDGSEVLRFELGTVTAAVNESVALGDSSIAFPVLENFNLQTGSGSGYIWIAGSALKPNYIDWSISNEFLAIILHELGHVLGCDHVPETIMAADLSTYLAQASATQDNQFLSQIDFQRELLSDDGERSYVPARNCASETLDSFTLETADTPPDGFRAAWRELLGREPVLNSQTRIQLTNYCTALVYADQLGTVSMPIVLQAPLGSMISAPELFIPFAPSGGDWSQLTNSQYEKIGLLMGAAPEQLIFRRNIESPVQIDLLVQGKALPVFRTRTAYEEFRGSR